MWQEWRQFFIVQNKQEEIFLWLGLCINFKAARKCGYLKDVIEPIDPREAKTYLVKK